MTKLLLLLSALFVPLILRAEGTKELRPAEANKGNLLLMSTYTMFGQYGAPPQEQIKIRIAEAGEIIYFGFNNKTEDQGGIPGTFVPNVPFRIVSPSGNIVYTSTMPGPGTEGHISSWTQAVSGPAELGNAAGYDALQVTAAETGDYVIEFRPASVNNTRLNIHLFDITVAKADNIPLLGRLHSQGWQISTEAYSNTFYGKVYPYDGGNALYEVDFNGLQPYVFTINFNSKGTSNTGNFINDRQSKIGNHTFPEYEVFLNPPDDSLYPVVKREVTMSGDVTRHDCRNVSFCLNYTANAPGILEGFIDLNANGIYDAANGEVYFSELFDAAGTKCIPWNGKDANGRAIDVGEIKIVSSFGFGMTHLPLYDVEHNKNGYIINVVKPEGSTPPRIFWDDSRITDGSTLGDELVNLNGCQSVLAGGCHRWQNRGDINRDRPAYQETINTWWYSTMVHDTMLYTLPIINNVDLSFHPTNLVKNDTSVCRGDSLSFYVYNDGESHFNAALYSYEWFINSTPMTADLRQHREPIYGYTEIVVKSTERSSMACIDYDTLKVNVVDPLKLTAVVKDQTCESSGSVEVTVISGPSNPQFFWQEFPGNNTRTLSNLNPGTYHLYAQDPRYSASCAADSSFTINGVIGISIDRIETEPSLCYEATGEAEVFMTDPAKEYEYSWNNTAFGNETTSTALMPGSYSILVRDINTGCTDTEPFIIASLPIKIQATKEDELCKNAKGQISLTLPPADFTISWNGVTGKEIRKENLSSGTYNIVVQSTEYSSCSFDTTILINNIDRNVTIAALTITPSDCGASTGAAAVTMPINGYNYLFSWNDGSFGNIQQLSNLAPGNYTLSIKETETTCAMDTAFFIPGSGFSFNANGSDEVCGSGNGSATVIVLNPDVQIQWTDGSTDTERTHLHEGNYEFTLTNPKDPGCVASGFVAVGNHMYTVEADFSIHPATNADTAVTGETIIFTNLTPDIHYSFWTFGDGATSNDNSPEHSYDEEGSYLITLQVTDINGCIGQVAKPIGIKEAIPCGIALPNAFSPNRDNMNDDIGILGYADKVDLKIFNRWGEVIFRTVELRKRWNGTYRDEESPVGVYPYILEWECPDSKGNMIKKTKVGDITLIR